MQSLGIVRAILKGLFWGIVFGICAVFVIIPFGDSVGKYSIFVIPTCIAVVTIYFVHTAFSDVNDHLRTAQRRVENRFSCNWGFTIAAGCALGAGVGVANGYSVRFSEFIRHLRDSYPSIVIIAGNVVTGEMTEELILAGTDIVKVGIGPGSVCKTRIQTGVGYPQLSAVIEWADAAHGLGGRMIADGGCTCPRDVAKAFAGGADFVMLGGMLAGHDEGGGKVLTRYYRTGKTEQTEDGWQDMIEERKFVNFYRMNSQAANDKHFVGLKEYRSSEGREIQVPYPGPLEDTVQDLLGGFRSTCTYAFAEKLKWLSKCTTFV